MSDNVYLILKKHEKPLLKAIMQKLGGSFEMHELCIKETRRKEGYKKIIVRNIVTHSDRGLLEIMPNGGLREMSKYTYQQFTSDNDVMPKSPEGGGVVIHKPLDEAWALAENKVLNGAITILPTSSNSKSPQPDKNRLRL